jgi:hypothetical protein
MKQQFVYELVPQLQRAHSLQAAEELKVLGACKVLPQDVVLRAYTHLQMEGVRLGKDVAA